MEQFITYRCMFNDLNRAGEEFPTEIAAKMFVCKLPKSFNTFKMNIFSEISSPGVTPMAVTMSSLGNLIVNKERMLRAIGELPELKSQAGQTFHAPGVVKKSCQEWKKSVICYYCDEKGHIRNECPKKKCKDREERKVEDEKMRGQKKIKVEKKRG